MGKNKVAKFPGSREVSQLEGAGPLSILQIEIWARTW